MIAVPTVTPVTIPVEPTDAIPDDPELQVPPLTASVRFVVVPTHNPAIPVIVPVGGAGLTVTTVLVLALPQ